MNSDTRIQSRDDLEQWYSEEDPWGYESHPDDAVRKRVLLSELPDRPYRKTLDIGCGNGFLTRDLPGDEVIGVDLSERAIAHAQVAQDARLRFIRASIFDLPEVVDGPFDLIVITGVLYPQYVGKALSLVYRTVDTLLAENGILASVHISQWCQGRFPLLRMREHYYPYREYTHRLELYVK